MFVMIVQVLLVDFGTTNRINDKTLRHYCSILLRVVCLWGLTFETWVFRNNLSIPMR